MKYPSISAPLPRTDWIRAFVREGVQEMRPDLSDREIEELVDRLLIAAAAPKVELPSDYYVD